MRTNIANEEYQGGNVSKTFIVVQLEIQGFHNWPDAFRGLEYLRQRHRHIFKVTIKKEVKRLDREIEIITLRNTVVEFYGNSAEFEDRSCERIADEMLKRWDFDYVQVLEDGENGAEVYK